MTPKRPLTTTQLETLTFMRAYGRANGMPPTVREIAEQFSIQINAAMDRVRALRTKGVVTHTPYKARGWRAL